MEYVDVGYRLLERFWNQGIGFEAAWHSLNFGFSILRLKEIYASAQVENIASNRILKKCGMTMIQEYEEDQKLLNEYRITLKEWMERSTIE
jgi:ribosomal-protein-alanine N-acetyltransferase